MVGPALVLGFLHLAGMKKPSGWAWSFDSVVTMVITGFRNLARHRWPGFRLLYHFVDRFLNGDFFARCFGVKKVNDRI